MCLTLTNLLSKEKFSFSKEIKVFPKAQQQGLVRTDKTAQSMANLLVNGWQGALLRMKIEQSSAPLKECCQDLLHDYFLN